jgi:zinc-ribbon domain
MAFCTNCGTQLGDNAKFCLNCGQPVGAGAAAATYYPPAPPVQPLKYDIEGHNLQIASRTPSVGPGTIRRSRQDGL